MKSVKNEIEGVCFMCGHLRVGVSTSFKVELKLTIEVRNQSQMLKRMVRRDLRNIYSK